MKHQVLADALPTIPWEDRPADCQAVLWRYSRNPIIGRNPIPRSDRVFNSAVVPFEGRFAGVFRADEIDGMPRLHTGFSNDALAWDIDPDPIVLATPGRISEIAHFEHQYDPRVCRIDDAYYVTWCNGYHGPTIGLARTRDFRSYEQLENAFLPHNRNGVLFPRKINGCYAMLSRPSDTGHTPFGDIFYSESPDLCHWGRHRFVYGASGRWWESLKTGAGPIPIETSAGWLLFHHGVCRTCSGYVYRFGVALLDRQEPWRVLTRCRNFILGPEAPYETAGFVANVTFPCAALCDAATGRLAIYYGAADTYTAVAFGLVDEIIDYVRAFPA